MTEPTVPEVDLATFYLLPIRPDGGCSCFRGTACKAIGKHPPTGWNKEPTLSRDPKMPDKNRGVALATGSVSGVIVVDCDNAEAISEFLRRCPEAAGTWQVKTPRGKHFWFVHPGFHVWNSVAKWGPKIDIRGDGGFVCMPGSPHRSGGQYTLLGPDGEIQDPYAGEAETFPILDVPEILRSWLEEKNGAKKPMPDVTAAATQGPEDIEGARRYLQTTHVPLDGAGDHKVAFATAQVLVKRYGLGEATALTLWQEVLNPRWGDRWSDTEILHKLREARTKGTIDVTDYRSIFEMRRNKAKEPTVALAAPVAAAPASGDKKPRNYLTVPDLCDILRGPEWAGVFRWNQLTGQPDSGAQGPLHRPLTSFRDKKTPCYVLDVSYLMAYFRDNYGFVPSKASLDQAIETVTRENPFHPIVDYLAGLEGLVVDEPTKSAIIRDACKATVLREPTEYDLCVYRKWLRGCIARILGRSHGVKMDTVLVLRGNQGQKKTTFVQSLMPDRAWAGTLVREIHNKDTWDALSTKWIVEMPELTALKEASVEEIKAFLDTEEFLYRPAYGRLKETRENICCYIGTTNEDRYLRDATGDRRFWPLEISEGKINVQWFEENRDLLWAAILDDVKKGEIHWLTDEESETLLAPAQEEAREEGDPLVLATAEKLVKARGKEQCTMLAIYKELYPQDSVMDRRQQLGIIRALRLGGWEKTRSRIDGKLHWYWKKA